MQRIRQLFSSRREKRASIHTSPVGEIVLVHVSPDPVGSVLFEGQLWVAKGARGAKFQVGERAKVIAADGTYLLIDQP